ncbi:MAG: magnesium transporter, partial [Armatimonadetes bacterium]|nr:magnesium transporter [Armatimonadota bacterium]
GNYGKFMLKQVLTALIVSLVCAVAAAVTGSLLLGEWGYGIIVGTGMLVAVVLGSTLGCVLALVFDRIGIDPAIASGPLVGTLNDAVSFFIYFMIAGAMLHLLGLGA